jgi:hypothetical protein
MTPQEPAPSPKKTKAHYAYLDEQERLKAKISRNHGKFVFLDPDGTWSPWLIVAITASTDVVYENQCAGTGCEHRLIEGFLVPIGGSWVDPAGGAIGLEELTAIFHQGKACVWNWKGNSLPPDRLEGLKKLVENIPFWACSHRGEDRRLNLKLDFDRVFEIAEGWIPIVTTDGPGVLLFQNCD